MGRESGTPIAGTPIPPNMSKGTAEQRIQPAPIRSVMALLVLGMLVAAVPPASAQPRDRDGDHPLRLATTDTDDERLAQVAAGALQRREEPFRPPTDTFQLASGVTIVQEYFDTCGEATSADLDRLSQLDDQAAEVAWAWSTCVDRAFQGTEEEFILFLVDPNLQGPAFLDDYAIVQYMDGFYEVFRTFGQADATGWQRLDNGFGEVGASDDGRRTVGRFVIDGVASSFPLTYDFVVATSDGARILDTLPNDGQPYYPRFPTRCSLLFDTRVQVTVEDGRLDQVRGMVQDLGLTVTSVAPTVGSLTLDDVDESALERLAALPGVRTVERPQPRTFESVNDPEPSGWATSQLHLDDAWRVVPSHPVHVAVLDTGVDALREDLHGRVGVGFDAVAGAEIPAGQSSAMGDHGTMVSGVVAATPDNGVEVAGVNAEAVIRPVRISGHDGCLSSEAIVAGLDAVAAMPDVRLVNLSFVGPASVTEAAAIDRVVAAGKIIVAASGNNGQQFPGQNGYPAAYPQVIAVGASTADGTVAAYSQQAAVDLIAPGGSGGGTRATDIAVLGRFAGVEFHAGTSFSAPYVVGALSLWLAGDPDATVDQARSALHEASVDVAGTTADGAGILDVSALLADTPPASRFIDIAGTAHEAAIEAVAVAGITSGFHDGTFRPADDVTRGQMAAFLTRSLRLSDASGDAFTDTAGTAHEAAIEAVAAADITSGFEDATFRPADDVTRGQMAAFLTRALELPASDDPIFEDTVGTSHAADIESVAAAGITSGFTDGTFRPDDPVSRGQMASFLARALDL